MHTVETRQMPQLMSGGRYGKRIPHVVLVSPRGTVLAIRELNKWRSEEKARAELQKIAERMDNFTRASSDATTS